MQTLVDSLMPALRALAVLCLFCSSFPAYSFGLRDSLERTPVEANEATALESVSGVLHRMTIEDRVAGASVRVDSLAADDGRKLRLHNVGDALLTGTRVVASGRRNGNAFVVETIADHAAVRHSAPKAGTRATTAGTLRLLHVDFEQERSTVVFEVHEPNGRAVILDMDVAPDALQSGMEVTVTGVAAGDSIVPETVTITSAPPPSRHKAAGKAVATAPVLVILMTFTDSGLIPFSQAQVQAVVAGGPGSGSVAELFKEASFGQQLLAATVTPWLSTGAATPAGCNWSQMGALGRSAAAAAGYNVLAYQKLVYVFPAAAGCDWIGLGYIGASGAWINGRNATSVYGHELGHNFGLLHAGSLRCTGAAIGSTCSANEYGDPFDVMGNQSSMHFNAAQKVDLGWIGGSGVTTHLAGTATYTLSPIEMPASGQYAIRIQASLNRTYWVEYRQPFGFDAGLASYPNNGVQIRVASPLETLCAGCDAWSNDTQLLDMTPWTATFTDAALTVGQTFTDAAFGISITVLTASSIGATVRVTSPASATATHTTLASSLNPAPPGAPVTLTATVTGNSPTGTVAFQVDGTALNTCAAVPVTTSSTAAVANCSTATLAVGTHTITATYSGDSGNTSSSAPGLSQVISGSTGTNVALASAGAIAFASSTYSAAYPASAVINGERAGSGWAAGTGGWNDATASVWPDWIEIDFAGAKSIDRVVVYTLQDNVSHPTEPTDTMTFSAWGVTAFTVQGWNGSAWIALATVGGNNLVKRTVTFPAYTTDRIRIVVTGSSAAYSRITEVEAWGVAATTSSTNVARASAGALAFASSTYNASFPVSTVINGERAGLGWGAGSGGWNDATAGAWPDWVEIDFAGIKTIDRVVVYTLQDNVASPVEPTDSMTFTKYGVTDFVVEGWNGSNWVPLATVTGNSLVKRTVNVSPFTTDRIRIVVTGSLAYFSRITEVEAWGVPATAANTNVALARAGAVAIASSTYSAAFPVASVIDGERAGIGWGAGSGGWNDGTAGAWPDWVEIDFAGAKTISRVVLYTVQDNVMNPIEPTDTTTFSTYGVTAFAVQGWNGVAWVTLANVSGNNLAKRTVSFTPYTTDRIRVVVTASLASFSRITEIEAWGN